MFGGSYSHSLDSAGRFVMPKRFRTQLGEDFIITRGLGCLCVFPRDYVDKTLAVELGGLGTPLQALFDPNIVRLTRHFYMDMVQTNADSQNRVQLTPEHRKFSGIEDEVIVCGAGEYVELWSPAALEKYRSENSDPDRIIASAAALIPAGAGERDVVSQAGPA
jgi:MraZ protein